MAAEKVARRVYPASQIQLFGVCLTALGQLRATIELHDVEQGTIVATLGVGALAPLSELSLVLLPLGALQTELEATWRARKRGGDRRLLAAFLALVDALVGQA
jgi:hypothetical protein